MSILHTFFRLGFNLGDTSLEMYSIKRNADWCGMSINVQDLPRSFQEGKSFGGHTTKKSNVNSGVRLTESVRCCLNQAIFNTFCLHSISGKLVSALAIHRKLSRSNAIFFRGLPLGPQNANRLSLFFVLLLLIGNSLPESIWVAKPIWQFVK